VFSHDVAWGTPPSRATLAPVSVWTTAHRVATGTFEDPANARIIYLAVGGLLLLAVLLGVGTWWWWRSAKVEHPVLAPLEVMSARKFEKADFTEQQRQLDDVRAAGADLGDAASSPVEPVDLERVLDRDDPPHFDDLAEPTATPEPAVLESAVEEPAALESAVEEPSVEEPAGEQPVVEEPLVEERPIAGSEDAAEPATVSTAADDASQLFDMPVATAVAVLEPVGETSAPTSASASSPAAPAALVEAATPQPAVAEEAPVAESPVQLAMPIVVIDTAPAAAVVPILAPVEHVEATQVDDTPTHFDPLLRPRID